MENKNESLKWYHEQDYITCDAEIEDVVAVRGVYGLFVKREKEECVYVGRSNNIYFRMFSSSGGHITKLRKNIHTNQQLKRAVEGKSEIMIRILEKVPFVFDNYYKDMQRLASVENKYIDYYQDQDQCLEQVPEGTAMTKGEWEGMLNRIQKESIFIKE